MIANVILASVSLFIATKDCEHSFAAEQFNHLCSVDSSKWKDVHDANMNIKIIMSFHNYLFVDFNIVWQQQRTMLQTVLHQR